MTSRRTQRKKRRSPYLFIILFAVLLIALVIVSARAMNTWNEYEAEAAVTPVPTATVRPVSVTPDPNRATPTPAPTAAPSPTPSYLSAGAQGQMVAELQTRLQELGYYTGKIDGDYGSGTKAAVQAFQQMNGLDADGVAGQKTLAVLFSDSAVPKPGPVDTLAGSVPLLVNKWNPLPAGFEPADLVTVKDLAGNVMTYERDSIQAVREATEALIRMLKAAQADGISPWKLREAYRTVADQQRIFNNRVKSYEDAGNTHSQALAITRREVADPGSSEHQLGVAIDIFDQNRSRLVYSEMNQELLPIGILPFMTVIIIATLA